MTISPFDKIWIDEFDQMARVLEDLDRMTHDDPPPLLFYGVDWALGADESAVLIRCMKDGTYFVCREWRTREELLHWSKVQNPESWTRDIEVHDLLPLEIGVIERFRFIESPLLPEPEMPKSTLRHVVGNSKKGRQLNSPKVKRAGRSYRGQPMGGKELERGCRSYMVTHYPPIFNQRTGEWQKAVKIPGHGVVCTMSKKQFDENVTYTEG